MRKAAREQMRQGADHVKIMMSGGVASPYDPLDSLQFSKARCARRWRRRTAFGRYVCAHAYSAEAITRAARLGVRTIEHGNLIDDAAAKLMAEKGMFLVANLVAYYAMKERAAQVRHDARRAWRRTRSCIEGACGRSRSASARRAGRLRQRPPGRAALGPEPRVHRSGARWWRPIEIIRSATTIAAQILRLEGKVGTLAPGAFADLLVVDGDPLKDLALLEDQGKHLSVIMKAGKFHKNRLH